ncbi:MAG: hypothetical protein SFU83_04305 [Meiothermus sp.]|nr:hypothetical protein [Meiothermus sp.]
MPSLYAVFEREIGLDSPDFFEVDEPWFEALAGESGLMRFFGQSPYEYFDEEAADGLSLGEVWFEAEGGLKAVETLLGRLEGDESGRARRAKEELGELRRLLEAAAKRVRFHLALDI